MNKYLVRNQIKPRHDFHYDAFFLKDAVTQHLTSINMLTPMSITELGKNQLLDEKVLSITGGIASDYTTRLINYEEKDSKLCYFEFDIYYKKEDNWIKLLNTKMECIIL